MTFITGAYFSACGIGKHKEFVSQQVHLQYCLLRRHGLQSKGLCADAEITLLRHIVAFVFGDTDIVPQSLGKSCFVFSYLPLDTVHTAVQRVHKSGAFVLAAEKEGSCRNSHLHALNIAHP